PMAANCTEIVPGDPFTATRQRWGGSLLEDAHLKGAVKLLTLAPHALPAEASPSRTQVAILAFSPALGTRTFACSISRSSIPIRERSCLRRRASSSAGDAAWA